MKVSTSINVFFDQDYIVPVEEQIQRVYDAGFRTMDMNFWDWSHPGTSPFCSDNWEKWVDGIGSKAASLGVKFTQAHADVYNFYDYPHDEARYEMYLRSLKGAAMLEIPWITFHPSRSDRRAEEAGVEGLLADNIAYYRPLVELAGKLGTGIALENMSRAISRAEYLNVMVDALTEYGTVGVCWDTGHAHIAGQNQGESLRLLGHRLHALHIQDNDGVTDQHTAPFFGTIDWNEIMTALRDIGYPGDFTFEAHNIVRRMPMGARAEALRLLRVIGETLVDSQIIM